MKYKRLILLSFVLFLGLLVGGGAIHWTVNRVYVPPGKSLKLTYKGPLLFGTHEEAPTSRLAEWNEEGGFYEVGVQKELLGPGRHFYCPIWWKREIVDDIEVLPDEIAIFTSKLGNELPKGQILVDGDLGETAYRGTLRKVYGPGRYRVNPRAYEHKIVKTFTQVKGGQTKYSGWINIPTGFVGVVTYLTDSSVTGYQHGAGIQDEVIPPGIYMINPDEQHIDIIEIGYRETSILVTKQVDSRNRPLYDESGEPLAVAKTGISFPSNDGFDIQLDYTAVWGIMPDQAPEVIRTFGNIKEVEQKVISPQSESICRNFGSKKGAVEFLVGGSRKQFQIDTTEEFKEVLKQKDLTLLYGLVRHIYIPQSIRKPIQEGYIADELTLTREQEKLTASTEASLREEEQRVLLESERIKVETIKAVAQIIANGNKDAREIEAETTRQVAEVDRLIAEIEAQKTVMLGKANATAKQVQEEARSQKFALAVEAFGSPTAYNQWQFAKDLPENIDLQLIYAGEGTLWTDLKNVLPTLPLLKNE